MAVLTFRIVFATLCLVIGLASLRFLAFPMTLVMEHMLHYLPPARLATYAHLIGGPLALMLVPLQFWQGLRRKWPRVHRYSGYLYALSIAASGLGALAMAPHFLGSAWAQSGFIVLAVLWLVCTALAIWHARARRFSDHRIWMMRSAALTAAAITLRLIMPFLMASGWSLLETYNVTAWASWIINLVLVEWWLRRKPGKARTAQI